MSSRSPQHLLALGRGKPPPEVKGGEGDSDWTRGPEAWHRSMFAQRRAGASGYAVTLCRPAPRSAAAAPEWTRPSRTSPPGPIRHPHALSSQTARAGGGGGGGGGGVDDGLSRRRRAGSVPRRLGRRLRRRRGAGAGVGTGVGFGAGVGLGVGAGFGLGVGFGAAGRTGTAAGRAGVGTAGRDGAGVTTLTDCATA